MLIVAKQTSELNSTDTGVYKEHSLLCVFRILKYWLKYEELISCFALAIVNPDEDQFANILAYL